MNKNSIIYSIKVILLVAVISSCSDYLEQMPDNGLVVDEYWNTKEELHQVMMGAYAALADMDAHLFLNGELRADMLAPAANISTYSYVVDYYSNGNTNNTSFKDVMSASILTTNKFAQWDMFYKVINLCNHVIKYAPIIKERDATFSEYSEQAYICEATALRALMYFYLVRIYKDVPYINYPTEGDNVELYPVKESGEHILTTILEDLVSNGMVERVPDFYGDDISTIGRINRFAAYALIADIALWQFDYEQAISYIGKIENSMKYVIVPNNEWFTLFSRGNTFESIFEIQYDASNSQGNKLFNLTRNNALKYFYTSLYTKKLFIEDDFGNSSPEKTRKEGTLVADGNNYIIYKYVGSSPNSDAQVGFYRTSNAASANFIIYRYADILLMKAEALTQKDNPDFNGALEIINLIRARAYTTSISLADFSSSQLVAAEIILEERALELAYEGKRWWDLLRYARRNNFAQRDEFINKIVENAAPSERLILASKLRNPESWYLPIYQTEINNNKNLKQNPYYEEGGN